MVRGLGISPEGVDALAKEKVFINSKFKQEMTKNN